MSVILAVVLDKDDRSENDKSTSAECAVINDTVSMHLAKSAMELISSEIYKDLQQVYTGVDLTRNP
jgi:hypothetical protein